MREYDFFSCIDMNILLRALAFFHNLFVLGISTFSPSKIAFSSSLRCPLFSSLTTPSRWYNVTESCSPLLLFSQPLFVYIHFKLSLHHSAYSVLFPFLSLLLASSSSYLHPVLDFDIFYLIFLVSNLLFHLFISRPSLSLPVLYFILNTFNLIIAAHFNFIIHLCVFYFYYFVSIFYYIF